MRVPAWCPLLLGALLVAGCGFMAPERYQSSTPPLPSTTVPGSSHQLTGATDAPNGQQPSSGTTAPTGSSVVTDPVTGRPIASSATSLPASAGGQPSTSGSTGSSGSSGSTASGSTGSTGSTGSSGSTSSGSSGSTSSGGTQTSTTLLPNVNDPIVIGPIPPGTPTICIAGAQASRVVQRLNAMGAGDSAEAFRIRALQLQKPLVLFVTLLPPAQRAIENPILTITDKLISDLAPISDGTSASAVWGAYLHDLASRLETIKPYVDATCGDLPGYQK